jgi:hypothetical protein
MIKIETSFWQKRIECPKLLRETAKKRIKKLV